MIQLTVLVFTFLLVLMNINTALASACECNVKSPEDAFREADAVFIARIGSHSEHPLPNEPHIMSFESEILHVWKESVGGKTEIFTRKDKCGVQFDEESLYIIYAEERLGRYYTAQCSRTGEIPEVFQDIEYLRAVDAL